VVGWQKIFISGNIDGVVEGQRLKVKGIESKTFNLQPALRTRFANLQPIFKEDYYEKNDFLSFFNDLLCFPLSFI
jgi:hypothetical protein